MYFSSKTDLSWWGWQLWLALGSEHPPGPPTALELVWPLLWLVPGSGHPPGLPRDRQEQLLWLLWLCW